MKLTRIRIEQLRQFRRPLEIAELGPGLNLFHGPNESGKSTVVRAIRAAFFERHKSNSVEDLRPWGDSAAAPSIELDFVAQGTDWHLVKSFLQKKRCDLRIGSKSYSGDEAEDKLAELLGYQFPGRGASKATHWGIPGLLWVEQGSTQELEESAKFAADHLKSALDSLLGEVVSSGGDDIIQAVKARRAELLTGTGRARGEYAELGKEQAALEEQLQALEQRIVDYRVDVDRLGELRRQHQQDERDKPWEEARKKQREAEQRYREVDARRQEQQRDQQALDACRQNLALLRQQREQAEGQAGKLAARRKEFETARSALESLQADSPRWRDALDRAKANYTQAQTALKQARQFAERERLEQDIDALARQLKALADSLDKARTHQQAIRALREQAQAPIAPAALKRLKATQRELDEHRIRSQTIATRLHYELEPDQRLELDGKFLTGRGDTLLLDETRVSLPGFGTLHITPGGDDLGTLRRELERLEDAFAEQLQALNVASVEGAEQRVSEQQSRENQLRHEQELLASVAPAGVEALDAQHDDTARQLEAQRRALSELPPATSGEGLSVTAAEAALEACAAQVTERERSARQHQADLIAASRDAQNAEKEWRELQAELDRPDYQTRQRALATQIAEAGEKAERLESTVAERQRQIDAARPELLQQDMERFAKSAEQLERTFHDRKVELSALQSRLDSQGADGLEEQRDALAASLAHTRRRHDELQRRAGALDLLLGLLQDKRQALTRRLQAPLQKHLNHYLAVLFPNASLEVDEALVPSQLTRTGRQGPETGDLQALSFGAREQMGLISRLAYADLLREAGRPTLIILDDALVHSDEQRLAQMKRILYDAAQRHQILLFSCHPAKWQDLGVAPRELEALKAVVA